ncbi:MAG TPA: ferrochelatase [Flavisolibacter sp.]|nr:ferrochelatase [Flavisolibacter sp.]
MKKAVILMNLGSPPSTEVKDVRRYLDEFLMDEKVIDKSWLFRALLVKAIIVPFRAPKSAEAYKKIWTKEGSPLIVISKQQRDALESVTNIPVEIAMRYGNPSPKETYDKLSKEYPDLGEVLLIPMYPHYAMSSFETAVDYAKLQYDKGKYPFKLTTISPFYNNEDYLNALIESIKPWLEREFDHLLFSYHGLPERHILKGDITGKHCFQSIDCCEIASPAHKFCYRHQCKETTRLVAEKLSLPLNKWSMSFQSRLGREEWLKPYTVVRLSHLPSEGVKKLLVVCPAFVSDCLETLEEMAIGGSEIFLHAGGEEFATIPCLNVHPLWIETLAKWVDMEMC